MSPMLDHDSTTSSTPSTPPATTVPGCGEALPPSRATAAKVEIDRLQREHDAMQAALDELRSLLGGLVETVEAIALRNVEERNVLQRKLVVSVGTLPWNLDPLQAPPVMTDRVEQDSGEPDVLGLFASEFVESSPDAIAVHSSLTAELSRDEPGDASSSASLGLLWNQSTTGPAIPLYQPPASEHRRWHPRLLARVVRLVWPAVDWMRQGRGTGRGLRRLTRTLLTRGQPWARRMHDLRVRSESPQPRPWTLKLHGLRIALLVVASMAMTTWVGIKAGYPVSRSLIPLSPLTRGARTEAHDGREPPSRSSDLGALRLLPASKTAAPGTAAPAGQITASAQLQSTRSKTVPVPAARAALSSARSSSSAAEARGPSSRRVDPPPRIVSRFVGSLVIESQPSGADVFVDKGRVGMSPIRLSKVRAGSHTIRIDLDGYERWSRAVAVVTNQSTRVTAMMERDP
jgi:PEGA domain